MRHRLLYSLLIWLLAVVSCASPIGPAPGDQSRSTISYQPLPTQPPVPLSVSTVDKFVFWVMTMNSTQVDDVIKQIAPVASDNAIVDAVASRLSFTNSGSVAHQLVYLSILGQMKNERAIAPLRDYIYANNCAVLEQLDRAKTDQAKTTVMDTCALLKSHAVNMIAYINTPAARQTVLAAASNHPSKPVRLSAINSFLYNAGDSPAAVELVTRYVRPDERIFVGLPRLDPGTSLKEFDHRVAQFYRQHPDQLPPPPRQDEQR